MVRSGVGGAGRRRDDCHFFNFDFSLYVWLARVAGRERSSLRCKISDAEAANRTQALTLRLTIRFADAKAAPFGLAKALGGRDDIRESRAILNFYIPYGGARLCR